MHSTKRLQLPWLNRVRISVNIDLLYRLKIFNLFFWLEFLLRRQIFGNLANFKPYVNSWLFDPHVRLELGVCPRGSGKNWKKQSHINVLFHASNGGAMSVSIAIISLAHSESFSHEQLFEMLYVSHGWGSSDTHWQALPRSRVISTFSLSHS